MMMSNGRITLPKGFRFQPSDEELLSHYLEKKNQRKDPQIEAIIPEIDVCKHEPRDLPALVFTRAEFLQREWFTMADSPDMQWYFFSPRVFKHSKCKSTRSNRTTEEGSWKKQGRDRRITRTRSDKQIGGKRILTFYQTGVQKKQKTDWVIHEYYLTKADSDEQIGDFVLCRLKKKLDKSDHDEQDGPFCSGGEPSSGSCSMAFNVENQASKQLGNVLSISVEGQTDSCNSSDSDMVEELLDEPGNLDSLFNQPPPPQLQSPIKLGNVSHTTNVHIDECRKRKYQFRDNDPSPTKKNHISTIDVDELVSNTTSNSENHAADAIPKVRISILYNPFLFKQLNMQHHQNCNQI
ncbi:NAC domain-containing protein 83-like [Rosa rugosa]|uniref:NAC domain-containing protein 83-like n=1 Tax=Rosa rugosa TaxID=74645 RepID=UPI002B405D29|nr:NAC domain-containing protein 83-like [Rosa rugosa]